MFGRRGVAQVPLKVFREVEQGGLKRIEAAEDHRLYDLLAFAPRRLDDLIPSFAKHRLFMRRWATPTPSSTAPWAAFLKLILLNPGRVKKVQKPDYRVVFEVTGESGAMQEFPAEAIGTFAVHRGMDCLVWTF